MSSEPDRTRPDLPLRERLGVALRTAIKSRDRVGMAVLRSTLGAIDNAEAIDRPQSIDRNLAIEQIPSGVAAAEAARRTLTDEDVERLVRAEIAERVAAADQYDSVGRSDRAERLRSEIAVLAGELAGPPATETPITARSATVDRFEDDSAQGADQRG